MDRKRLMTQAHVYIFVFFVPICEPLEGYYKKYISTASKKVGKTFFNFLKVPLDECSRNIQIFSWSASERRLQGEWGFMTDSHSPVCVDEGVAGGTAMLHIFAGVHAERDTAAEKTPKEEEESTNEPGQHSGCVFSLCDHRPLAAWTHSLFRTIPETRS